MPDTTTLSVCSAPPGLACSRHLACSAGVQETAGSSWPRPRTRASTMSAAATTSASSASAPTASCKPPRWQCSTDVAGPIGVYLLPLRHPVLSGPPARRLRPARSRTARLRSRRGWGGSPRGLDVRSGPGDARRADERVPRRPAAAPVRHGGQLPRRVLRPGRRGHRARRWPPPIPIIIGGRSDAAIRRAAPVGDGWLGIWNSPSRFAAATQLAADEAASSGRDDPPTSHAMQVWCGLADSRERPGLPRARDAGPATRFPFERFERYCPYGTAEDVAEFLGRYVDAGCTGIQPDPAVSDHDQAIAGVAAGEEATGTDMTGSLVIAPRFCGPPTAATAATCCGLIVGYLDGPAEVTLSSAAAAWHLWLSSATTTVQRESSTDKLSIAEATRSPGGPAPQLPGPVSVQQASSQAPKSGSAAPGSASLSDVLCARADLLARRRTAHHGRTGGRPGAVSRCLVSRRGAREPNGHVGLSSCGRRSTAPGASQQSGTPSRVARHSYSVACRLARLARSAQASHMSCSAGA